MKIIWRLAPFLCIFLGVVLGGFVLVWAKNIGIFSYVGCSQPVDATLYLERQAGVDWDGSEIWSRFHGVREDGVMGSLVWRGVVEGDRAIVWQAVVVHSFSDIAARRDTACAAAAL